MFDRYIRSKKGLSLVEVLLASALLLIVFTGFINAFYYATNLRVNSQSRLQAVLKAQTCIEEIRSSRGTNAGEWANKGQLQTWLVSQADYSDSGADSYEKGDVKVSLIGSGSVLPAKLIQVNVEVSYADQMDKGKTRSVKLQTRLREF